MLSLAQLSPSLFFNLLHDTNIIEEQKQQGHKKLSNPEECLKKHFNQNQEKISSIMKRGQSIFPLRWMEGRNHASNWKCRRRLHNNQTNKYKNAMDENNKKKAPDRLAETISSSKT